MVPEAKTAEGIVRSRPIYSVVGPMIYGAAACLGLEATTYMIRKGWGVENAVQ